MYIISAGRRASILRRFQKLTIKSFTYFICAVLTLQPMMAELAYAQEIIIDPSGNVGFAPTMQRTSRPQVVDIATPNAGGVSHNQYTRFDVTSKGVVLNNSQTATSSQLAGNIAGNANLTNGSAATIVNEVTSTNTSTLNGSVEVAGTRANVIIANPNGITCSGCNFINAGTGTLTTGVPVIDGGNVRLNVTQGAITIGRAGLNGSANNVSNINLIGRTVVVDGKVTAIDGITVQGGALTYDVTTSNKTATLTGTGATPDFVVDGTAFGAMEAGRIQIIGNERGLGVRTLGAIKSTTGSVTIESQGDEIIRSVAAQGEVTLKANYGDLTIERDITSSTAGTFAYARHNVQTTDQTGIYGFTGVKVFGRNGALTLNGDIQSGADIDLYSRRKLTFGAYGSATGEFKLRSLNEVDVDGATIVANQVDATSSGHTFTLNNSAVFSAYNFQINTGDFHLGKDVVVDGLTEAATSNLVVNATGAFHNGADLRRHKTATINYAGNLYNEAGGIIEEANLNLVFDREVHNAGILYGSDSLNLDVAALFNNDSGTILSKVVSINTTGLLENKGTITSEGNISLTSVDRITNEGHIQGIRAYLTAPVISNSGELRVKTDGQLTASTSLTNNGLLASLGTLHITTGNFENIGLASVETTLSILADTITNRETLTAGTSVSLRTTGKLTNLGQIASYGNAELFSDTLVENQGNILVDNVVDIRGPSFVNTGTDAVLRSNIGRINTASIINAGKIYLVADFQRRRNIDYFENSGVFATAGKIELQGRDANSRAVFKVGSVLISGLQPEDSNQYLLLGKSTLIKFSALTLDGRISAGGSITLYGPTSLLVSGTVQARQNLILMADTLTVGDNAKLYAEGRGVFKASTKFTNNGVISLGSYLELFKNFGSFRNNNLIAAASTRKFTVNGTFENTGAFQTTGHMYIKAANLFNRGHLQAGGNVWLTASQTSTNAAGDTIVTPGRVLSSGTISAVGHAGLFGQRVDLETGSYLSAAQMKVTADRFYSKGNIALSGDARNDWVLSEGLWQYGKTYSDGEIRLTTGSLTTYQNSLLGSGKTLRISATNNVSLTGNLIGQDIYLTAANLSGADTASILSSNNISITTTGATKHFGELVGSNNITVNANKFDLRGNTFGARIALTASEASYTRGKIFATETTDISVSGAYSNYGLVEARDKLTIVADSIANYANTAMLKAGLSSTEIYLQSTATGINSTGAIFGARKITLKSVGGISNAAGGSIKTISLGLDASSFLNRGNIDVYGFFGKISAGAQNFGTITTETYFGLNAASFANRAGGVLTSKEHVYIKTSGLFSNYDTASLSGETIDLRVGSVLNSGTISATSIVNVADVTGLIKNTNTGRIYGEKIALLTGLNVRNAGIIGQTGSTSLPKAQEVSISASAGWVLNDGSISSTDIRILADSNIHNTGIMGAVGFLGLKSSASVSNKGILRASDARIDAAQTFDNQGLIDVTKSLYAKANFILSKDGVSRTAVIRGKQILLSASDYISNAGRIAGTESVGLVAGTRFVINRDAGVITGKNITLSGKGSVSSSGRITASEILAIEGGSINLSNITRATNSVSLKSTAANIEVTGVIQTRKLYVEAAQDIVAANRVFRGSELTQLIANDIHRSDVTGGTGKLATIYGAQKDIYVQLRTGSLGVVGPSRYNADGHAYDQVNWDVTGSISLIADAGDILVGGTLRAADDLYIRAGHDTMLGSGDFYAGDVLHLEGKNLLKNYGKATIGSGNKVQLLQNQGWFWTRDWLTDQDLHYSLSVQAKTIIVNSSHRFVNKDLFLRARDNILQQEQVVSARKITYSAGNNLTVRFYPSGWRRTHPDIQSTANWWDVGTAGLRGHTLLAQSGGLVLYAGNDIHLASGKIHSYGNLDIVAGRNVLSEPVYKDTWKWNRPGDVGWSFSSKYTGVKSGHIASKVKIRELRAYENQLSARGDIKIVAGGSASFIGSSITSQNGGISIEALKGGVNFVAAPGFWSYGYKHTRITGWIFRKKTVFKFDAFEDIYKRSRLKAANGNITIASTGKNGNYASVLSAGTSFEAQNISISTLNGNISAGTYAERSVTESYTHTSRRLFAIIPFGSSDTSITDNILINYGNDFFADAILDIAAKKTLTITGGTLTAQNVIISAETVNINAAINSTKHTFFSEKDNMITITTIQSGFDRETAVLPTISSTNTPVFNISGEVHIAGVRGATLNSQLLNIIGSRQYDSKLLGIASPEDVTSATEASAAIQDQYLRDFALPGVSDGEQFAYLDTLMNDYNATYHTISLRDHEWYDKQVRLNPAFKALLTVVATYITGGINFDGIKNVFIRAGVKAGTSNLIAGAAEGTITGNFDMDKILRGALLAGVSTTISGFLTDKIDLGSELGLSDRNPFANDWGQRLSPASLVDRAGDAVINNGVSNLVHGQGFFDGLDQAGRTFLVSETIAIAQFGIGELGGGPDTQWEGSVGHLLLHGGVGCLALEALDGDCVAGFFSGAGSSLLAGSNLTPEQKAKLAPLVGALTGYVFSGGSAVNVSFGGTITVSAIKNNYLGHTELEAMQKELRACEFNDAACFNAVATKYLGISQGLDAEFASCTTDACRMYHLSRILVADQTDAFHKMMSTLVARQYLANNNYTAALETLQYDRADSYSNLMSKPGFTQAARDQLKAELTEFACIGATANSCSIETRASLDTWGLLSADEKQTLNRDIFIEIVAAQQKARNALKPSICGSVSGQACETLIDDHIAAQQARAARIGGAFMLVGGTFEIVSGVLVGGFTCETGIGCLAAAGILTSGADNVGHGAVALWTGEQQTTFGAQLLMKTGLSQTQAEILYGLASAGVELAAMKYLVKRPTLLTDELLRSYTGPNRTLANADDLADVRTRYGLSGRDTVAVARTDIPSFQGQTFEGLSPALRREGGLQSLDDLYGTSRPIKSPNPNPIASRHAEEDIFNSIAQQIDNSGLTATQLNGRTVNIRISNAGGVCNVCYQGLGNSTATPGVIRQFSERYPGLNVRITAEGGTVRPGVGSITVRGGQIVD